MASELVAGTQVGPGPQRTLCELRGPSVSVDLSEVVGDGGRMPAPNATVHGEETKTRRRKAAVPPRHGLDGEGRGAFGCNSLATASLAAPVKNFVINSLCHRTSLISVSNPEILSFSSAFSWEKVS